MTAWARLVPGIWGRGLSSRVRWTGRTSALYAFTEQDVSMLSVVLRSDTAIEVSVRIMRAFVEMRHFVAANAAVFERIRDVELRRLEYQRSTDERFERVFEYMGEREVVLVDGYVDDGALNVLAKKREGVAVTVWTHPRTRLTRLDVDTFNAQYPTLEVRHTASFHDRFLILDRSECYHVGASVKDAGKRAFAITRLLDPEHVRAILGRLGG